MTILIFGATGAAGGSVLDVCLASADVAEVRAIVRRGLPPHDRLRAVVHADFLDFSPLSEAFRGRAHHRECRCVPSPCARTTACGRRYDVRRPGPPGPGVRSRRPGPPGPGDVFHTRMHLLLKGRTTGDARPVTGAGLPIDESAARIRCPRCFWQPTRSSLWGCVCTGTPEPPFDACGTIWNTFDTRGRCPGCSHQWIWTSCLRCGVASRHEDWYEQSPGSAPH